ncbi:MAG: RNA 2',3'-cyclic phosphodiesterase [Ignavibacteriaceae bacterium]|jgi:2'-5' RNA ligase
MNRLFIALKIPKGIREKIISFRDSAIIDYRMYKWEPEEKIHLTLKFIGEVKEELTESIINSLKFVTDYNSFECRLTRFGFFYKRGQSRILWIGLSLNSYIDQLLEKINKKLEKFSIPAERRIFQPHLTIKRLKGDEGKNFIDSFESFKVPDIQFKAFEVVLMRSDLLPSGSKYTEIKKYNLK